MNLEVASRSRKMRKWSNGSKIEQQIPFSLEYGQLALGIDFSIEEIKEVQHHQVLKTETRTHASALF